jgi:two-component system phosphate regulon sensor histidine kinase PhoR
MNTSLRKIYILILVIIILPSLIFATYEIGTLRQSEKVIEDIYINQLDAILYSINQYSEDVVSSWANRINNEQQLSESPTESLALIINEMPSVKGIFQYDSLFTEISCGRSDSVEFIPGESIKEILKSNKESVSRLISYLKSGYRKIESFDLPDDLQLLVFVTNLQGQDIVNALVMDSGDFINLVLDPKIQEIAGERFFISAFFRSEENVIYSSNRQGTPQTIKHRKAFWILDDYFLGIEMKDKTISDLAWERSRLDLIMIGVVELVLLIGVWIIYRNVKKQMELAQIKSEFVSNVSHEIRTPLALISMYIESLERGIVKTPEKVKEYYTISLQETQRLTTIVNKILNFSQMESGKRKYTFQNVFVNDVVEEVVKTFKLNLENQAFQWSMKLSEEDLQIVADREAVTDAVVNLIDNAIKYSGDMKKIDIKTGLEKERIFIEVKDAGLGISKSEQKHIFDKFYRVTQENLAHKAKGSGVGLAIVQHIMEVHEGDISVKSQPGKGSSFRLYFPKISTAIP